MTTFWRGSLLRRMRFFLTGSDTNAGKTFFARLVLERAREAGMGCRVWKPVCCGGREDLRILAAAQPGLCEDELCHAYFEAAAAPAVAAELEGAVIHPAALTGWCFEQSARHPEELMIFEGAGGWMVPLDRAWCIADLAESLRFPVIIVVGERLGCLNPTLLTVRDIERRGLTLAGIVLNQLPDAIPAAGDHRTVLERDFGLRVWGRIPEGATVLPDDIWRALLAEAGMVASGGNGAVTEPGKPA